MISSHYGIDWDENLESRKNLYSLSFSHAADIDDVIEVEKMDTDGMLPPFRINDESCIIPLQDNYHTIWKPPVPSQPKD